MDIPLKVEWTDAVKLCDRQKQSPSDSIDKELSAPAIGFSLDEMGKEIWRIIFDERDRSDLRSLKCIVVGRQELAQPNDEQAFYILVIAPKSQREYERVGVGSVHRRHIMMDGRGTETRVL
jgi:hypothetical protein